MNSRHAFLVLLIVFAVMTQIFMSSFSTTSSPGGGPSFNFAASLNTQNYGTISKSSMKRVANITVSKTYFKKSIRSAKFKLKARTNADTVLFYKNDNPNVVSVSTLGVVTVKGYGTAKISIVSPATKKFQYTVKTVKVKVADNQNLRSKKESYNLKFGSDAFALNLKNDRKDPEYEFSSGNTDVVRVSEDGTVRVTGLGETVIKVVALGNKRYHREELEIKVSVDKQKQTITVPKTKYTVSQIDAFTNLKAVINTEQDILYKSSNEKVATISSMGDIEPKGVGTCKVTIYNDGNEFYLPVSKIVTVVVRKADLEDERNAAVKWAVKIANNNKFTYGTGSGAHHNGCYYCGTNHGPNKYMKPSKKYLKTYCCNPFVTAAYAHGAKSPAMLAACKRATGVGLTKKSFTKWGCWKDIGKPSLSALVPGDVFVRNKRHVAIYIGNNQFVEAGHSGWGADTIAVSDGADKRYASRVTYVMRYIGG